MGARFVPAVLIGLLMVVHGQLWFGRGSVGNVAEMQRKLQTQKAANAQSRKQEVAYRHDNFLYNVSQIGNAAAFPMGKLGEERVAMAWDQWQVDRNLITTQIQKDVLKLKQAIGAVSGILADVRGNC